MNTQNSSMPMNHSTCTKMTMIDRGCSIAKSIAPAIFSGHEIKILGDHVEAEVLRRCENAYDQIYVWFFLNSYCNSVEYQKKSRSDCIKYSLDGLPIVIPECDKVMAD